MTNCPSCEHSLSEHFNDVIGVARCLHTDSGVSTSGIIGMHWSDRCDCENLHSKRAEAEAKREQEDRERHKEMMDGLLKRFRERREAEAASEVPQ